MCQVWDRADASNPEVRKVREKELSPEQAEVVGFTSESGHLLVLARPGSGKTHTLAARAMKLLQDGIPPAQILAMTFSTRAADQLKDRLPGSEIWAGTFHAVCADILEQHGASIGIHWPFRIADEARAREVLRRAISEVGFPLPDDERGRRHCLDELTHRIERRKRLGLERAEATDGDRLHADIVAHIDETYCRRLKEANTLDFADLIVNAVQVLEEDALVAEALRGRVSHLLVDEYHDISPEQYHLIALLTPSRSASQVFVVGDPDQAIYAWRGADAGKMLKRYRSDYKPTEFHLRINFRSRAPIVDAADALMRDAGRTHPSRPHREGKVRPYWCGFSDSRAEAQEVAASISRALHSRRSGGYGAFAVLYRTHAIGDIVEAELLRAEVPICRVQRERFFDDPAAQESLRYLELAFGLHDLGFEPALNWPRVIVDEVTMVHLRRLAERRGMKLFDLVRQIDALGDEISPLTRGVIREFQVTIGRDLGTLVTLPIAEALNPFLAALKIRRCPIPDSTREAMRDTLDLLEPALRDALSALDAALRAGQKVALHTLPGPDCAAAALIVRHALDWYFGLPIADADTVAVASNAFVVTLGEEKLADATGIGIGALKTRTVHLSVATRAWRLMQMMLMTRETLDRGQFLLLDVETSNKHPERAEILEFAAAPFTGGVLNGPVVASLIRPSSPEAIDLEATDVHGLRWIDVAEAPEASEALPALIAEIEDNVVVGHNVDGFDLQVLRRAAERAGLNFRQPYSIDTRGMAVRLWPGEASYRLEDLARRSDPAAAQRHRAEDDCLLAGRVFTDLLAAARRDREIDVLSECLPLVAASIVAGNFVVEHDNALLAGVGARSLGLGHGTTLFADWVTRDNRTDSASIRMKMHRYDLAAPEEDERWERLVQGWKTTIEAFCASDPDQRIGRFLRYAALAQPVDTLPRARSGSDEADPRSLAAIERVALMTVHSAKGLEWPVVFLVGVEDDQFPHFLSRTEEQLSEERRILYVGMTRAQDWLLLFSAEGRNGYTKRRSRFLEPLLGRTIVEVQPGPVTSAGS